MRRLKDPTCFRNIAQLVVLLWIGTATAVPVLDDYIATPEGFVHKSCNHMVPPNGVFDGESTIYNGDGSIAEVFAPCTQPHIPFGQAPWEASDDDQLPVGYTYGYNLTAAFNFNPNTQVVIDPSIVFNQIYAEWYVPENPSYDPGYGYEGQLIYIFPAIEGTNGIYNTILQPVLDWGYNGISGTGNFWSMTDYMVWTNLVTGVSTSLPSTPFEVTQGDLISGQIWMDASDQYIIKWIDETNGANYAIAADTGGDVSGTTFNVALPAALETDRITQCNEFPANGDFFENINIFQECGGWNDPCVTGQNANTWYTAINEAGLNCSPFEIGVYTEEGGDSALLIY
jgi:hypothetical protein